ncbi:MAG: single-stranded-DNA-specific exonuclease RecJ [Eubacteriales bacterium]
MSKWILTAKKADFQGIGKKYKISPVVARVIRNRDIIEEKDIDFYLNGNLQDLYDPMLLMGMEQAISVIHKKIREGKTIRVIGDYDVDGICSTYILVKGLKACGANVDHVIPHRQKDGYGLNENLIKEAYEAGIDTIITCDNGIAAKAELEYAMDLGMTAVVTDHHEVPYSIGEDGERNYAIPQVAALVDPKQPNETYPYPNICGAVVAFKVIVALLELIQMPQNQQRYLFEELIEFAGIATVCDVMELLDENRIIVKYALQFMKSTKNLGLDALLKVNEITPEKLASYHMGFVIGPCFNATGRLDSAVRALDLLLCKNEIEAMRMARELKDLNENRKAMTEEGTLQAIAQIEEKGLQKDKVIVVYLPNCHESLAGIIAGRVREKYYRPTFVLTKGEESAKGSARSIEEYHLYDEMCKCKELFLKFGGHKLAAGLSIEEEKIDVFRETINAQCTLEGEGFQEKIRIDVPMPLSYVTEKLIEELNVLEPFGKGNEKPVFADRKLQFLQGKRIGKNANMGKFTTRDEAGNQFELTMFRNVEDFDAYVAEKFGTNALERLYGSQKTRRQGKEEKDILLNVIYDPSINEYRGRTSVQFIMKDYIAVE